jgi:uncharacterized membrane protein YeaQ/YmgE (transglycosylase-associated protein family)
LLACPAAPRCLFFWVEVAFLAGAIAKLFIAGPGGIIVTILLGVVGAMRAAGELAVV